MNQRPSLQPDRAKLGQLFNRVSSPTFLAFACCLTTVVSAVTSLPAHAASTTSAVTKANGVSRLSIGASQSQVFNGAEPAPIGVSTEAVSQLTIRFPETMQKPASHTEPFTVTCLPAIKGFSSWADNNGLWTFNLKADNDYSRPRLVGGTKCDVVQSADLTSASGKTWKAGTINYSVIVPGPNVTAVSPASGFNGTLRESEPVVFITFDGPVDKTKFFADQSGYIGYLSANAPSEKMPLSPVPDDQAKAIFAQFKRTSYMETEYKDRNWILATTKQNLIPGAQVSITIQNQVSADNPSVHSTEKVAKEFGIRSQLEAKTQCASPTAQMGTCLPKAAITVAFNGQLKWSDVKETYIEYVPYKSADGKFVRTYPELANDQEIGIWNTLMDVAGNYFPFLAKYSDTVVNSLTFQVDAEPQTQAKVVIPAGLKDIDSRVLSASETDLYVNIGAMSEIIQVPQALSFFEKNVPNLYLPVGVVNLHQKLSIRKTGTDAGVWAPITDVGSMIQIIRAYQARGMYRKTATYTSPLDQMHIASTTVDQQLVGTQNRPNALQFPFGKSADGTPGGFYAIEISSPTFEAGRSDAKDDQFYNPKYVLAQVTNLAVHLKKGNTQTVAWVTKLSEAQPVAGASVQIYNCLGQPMATMTTNASGLATFPNQKWATDCQAPGNSYSSFFQPDEFYAVAKLGNDQALTHSSWNSQASPYTAPGVDMSWGDVSDNTPHFHAIVGVNLVKPGQKVPVELIAKLPNSRGFTDLAAAQLPTKARVSSVDDDQTFYEFPLTWSNGEAGFTWGVPSDSSVKLGRYTIKLTGGANNTYGYLASGDIEVAEFKVPLMTGIISLPAKPMVQPKSIPVNTIVRYANGVGAKKLPLTLSYYFESTTISSTDLPDFQFGTGAFRITDEDTTVSNTALPSSSRPATIEGLMTGADGSLTRDLATEKVADGRTIAEVLATLDQPQKLVVRVRYQDQMGEFQTLSQAKDIFNSSQYIGTSLVSGSRADAKLRATNLTVDGKINASVSDLQFKVMRVETKVIGEELFGGMIKNTLEREIKPVRWAGKCVLDSGKKFVNCPIGQLKEGFYAFQVTSTSSKQVSNTVFKVDADGRTYGRDDFYGFGDSDGTKQLPLVLNKKSYKNGDQAIVSFSSPFKSCRALVTIERSDVIDSMVVPNACEKGFVTVPVNASLAPNAFISVYAITGRATSAHPQIGEIDFGRPTYRLGFANMKVDWNRFKSDVVVKTDKASYKPGEMVNVQVAVHPEEGQLKNGTATLIAIEEKILELKPNDTYQLLDGLMQIRADGVQTITPLSHVETVTADNSDVPGAGARKGGSDGGDGSSKSDFKRKLFDALVAFQPAVPVVNGMAQFSFKSNDSLTKFKIFVVTNDPGQKFGTGEVEYLNEQEIQTYANTSTSGYTGDSGPVVVTVQNNGAKAANLCGEVTMTVRNAAGKAISTQTMKKCATVDKSGSSVIQVGQATVSDDAASIDYAIRVIDANGKVVDSLTPPTEKILPAVPLAVHDSFIVQTTSGALTQAISKEPDALPGKGQIRVTVSKSLVTGALSQITQRLDNSLFADFFLESQFYKALLKSSEAKPDAIKAVLQSMVGDVDKNGFVKYMPEARIGSLWLTASIINALQQEPWAMKLVQPALLAKFKMAVTSVLTKHVDPRYIGETSAVGWMRADSVMGRAAYAFGDSSLEALALTAETSIFTQLAQNPAVFGATVDKWSSSDLVDLWLLQVFADPTAAKTSAIYKQLLAPARLVYTGNMAQLSGQPAYLDFYTDETIESAKLLFGHAKLNGANDKARALAVGLVNASSASWYSSSTMFEVAESLKTFGRTYEAEAVDGTAQINIVEEQKTASADWSKVSAAGLASDWTNSKATVQVTQAGSGQPWVGIQAMTAVPLTKARGQGLSVDKQIKNLTHDSGYQTGDVIEVTLTINASGSVQHVAINDPIPAGSNIVGDGYGDFTSGQKSYSGYKFYVESLPIGAITIKYQYQLNNPGSFKLPPTRAEGLFMPSIFGEAPNAAITVK